MSDLAEARRRLDAKVLGRPGVEGTAIGERGGRPCLLVYASSDEARRHAPSRMGGFRVIVEKTGSFQRHGP